MIKLRFKKSLLIITFSILCISLMMAGFLPNAHAQRNVNIGDIFVVDDTAEVVFKINPITGDRIIVSDFLNPSQGPAGDEPKDLVMEPNGSLCVLDSDGGTNEIGAIYNVNVLSGDRTVTSDLGDPEQGPMGNVPERVAIFTNGNLYFSDRDGPDDNDGAILQVDKDTGFRTLVTDFANPAQGPLAQNPNKITEGPGGVIYVTTSLGGVGNEGILFEVDPVTGNRTIISQLGDAGQGPLATNVTWITANPAGGPIYLSNNSTPETIMMVDPNTGNRTIVSDFSNPGQGPTNENIGGIAIEADGQLLVNGRVPDAVYRIDPILGLRKVVSDLNNPAEGPIGSFPQGIIVATVATIVTVPTMSEWGLIATAAFLGIISFIIIRRRNATV